MECLQLERREGLAVITLNRPERLNALSLELVGELHAVLDELDGDLATRVLILSGAGRAFCAGTDLKDGVSGWHEDVGEVQSRYRLQQHVARLTVRLREIPQPVIAAVHGNAAGGGMSLAMAADIRVCDPTARFNGAFIRIGASGGDLGSSWLLPRIVGPSTAAELLYTGRFVDAEEALRIGLVSTVTGAGQHVEAARAIAEEIMQNSPFGVRMTKELLNQSLDAPGLRQQIELENRTQILCSLTADHLEGVAAFAERRPARYEDR